jgi:hypothetical protein
MWHLRTIFMLMAGIFLLCLPELRADSLQLKNGNFVQGKYLGGSERAVEFEVNGKIRMYDIEEILSISFAAASADGSIPSNNADPKPNANTELNSAAKGNGELRTARSKQTEALGSSCAIEANSQAKARVSPTAARSMRIVSRRLPVLSD